MKNQLPLALLFTLGGIFAAMGALLLYVALLKPMLLTWKSSSWIETPATVTECRLENRSRGAMTIVINYHYYYNKIKYCGNRYDFFRSNGNATSWRIDNMREIVRSLPPGTRTTCLVDPQKPSEAVISRKIFLSPVALLLPVLFLSIGVGMLLAAIKRLLKKPTRKIIKKLLFPVMLALLTLPGCVQTVTLVVFNNSGKDVCVTALSEKYDLKSQTCIKIGTAAGISYKMQISDSSKKGYTAVLTIPQIGTIHENLYLQIEEDMKIYRVHNDKFPHNPLPEQTEGFPVDLAGGKQ